MCVYIYIYIRIHDVCTYIMYSSGATLLVLLGALAHRSPPGSAGPRFSIVIIILLLLVSFVVVVVVVVVYIYIYIYVSYYY